MTDRYGVPEFPEDQNQPPLEPDQPPEEQPESSVLDGAGDFTSAEGLVAFAGMVLLAVWLIFDLIVDNYNIANTIVVIAALAVILPRLDRDSLEKFHPLPLLMKIVGWALALFGALQVIVEIRNGVYDDFGIVIAALIAYAGYLMAFMGARQIKL